jgi:hypothetical protein
VDPVRPDYEGACVTNVVHGLLGRAEWAPPAVREARAVVLLVLDGFGWNELERRRGTLPNMAGMEGGPITTVVPSTTPTALVSISTGLAPSEHGIVGYRLFLGEGVLNVLRWKMGKLPVPNPAELQPREAFGGQRLAVVSRAQFEESEFTSMLFRGSSYHGWFTTATMVELCRDLTEQDQRFVYAYYDGPDLVAHMHGMRDAYLQSELSFCDGLVGALLDSVSEDVAVVVTADHGHVHFDEPLNLKPLAKLTEAQSGESRFRYLHARHGAASDLLAKAKELYADHAWIFEREQLIEEGWLGPRPPSAKVARRIGDVILAARKPIGFVDPANPGENKLLSGHGSLTPDEMLVPLIGSRGRR